MVNHIKASSAILCSVLSLCINCQAQENGPDTIDPYRPAYHFTAPANWLNDPNGLVYLDGEYHMFYQLNPYGIQPGHLSWGHAVSRDLVSWKHQPVAMTEFDTPNDSTRTMIFSGSAVIDSANTSRLFEKGKKDGMVAIYTAHVHSGGKPVTQYQNLAYSVDKGRTWRQFEGNPVLDLKLKDFRDPNVFWYAPGGKWIMSVVKPLDYTIQFYESVNLRSWKLAGEFARQGDTTKIWECPSLFEVPIEGSAQKKWVLAVSCGHRQNGYLATQYFVGDFDGKAFKAQKQPEVQYLDEGKDFYAAIPFNNLPGKHEAPVIIGWLNDWEYADKIPTTRFRGAMSVPRSLYLRESAAGFRLIQKPQSIKSLHRIAYHLTDEAVAGVKRIPFRGNCYEMELRIDVGSAQKVGVNFLKSATEQTRIEFDAKTGLLSLDRTKSGNTGFHQRFASIESARVSPVNGIVKLRIFVDKSVVEVFANEGEAVLTDLVFPTKQIGEIEVFANGGQAVFKQIAIAEILPE